MMEDAALPTELLPEFVRVRQILSRGLDDGAFGGVVALATFRQKVIFRLVLGWACREPQKIPLTFETLFDLASLTKVVATLPAVLLLVARGLLDLDQPVGELLPALGLQGWQSAVTIRRLLSHTSGLPAWLPLYLHAHGSEAYVATIGRLEPAAPGQQVIYSDLNFILLGEVVRAVTGQTIAEFAAAEIFAPLGMHQTLFRPPPSLRPRIAATERGNSYERERVGAHAVGFSRWRQEMIWGEVHDGNAFYGLDGIAGHAGLFSTAADLARYGQFWLHRGSSTPGEQLSSWGPHGSGHGSIILPASLMEEATRPQAPGRGLGWMLAHTDSSGNMLPARGWSSAAYGHTGFTGTSLWIEPTLQFVLVLLTNRVHPTVQDKFLPIRSLVHAELIAAARRLHHA